MLHTKIIPGILTVLPIVYLVTGLICMPVLNTIDTFSKAFFFTSFMLAFGYLLVLGGHAFKILKNSEDWSRGL